MDVIVSWSDGLKELIVEIDGACAAGEFCALPACPLVRKSKVYQGLSQVIHNQLKRMGGILSIETIDGEFGVVGPLNSEHQVSLRKYWLLRNKFVGIIKCSISLGCFLDLLQVVVALFVGFEDIDFISFVN